MLIKKIIIIIISYYTCKYFLIDKQYYDINYYNIDYFKQERFRCIRYIDNNIILQYKNKCMKYENDYIEYVNNKNKIILYNTIVNIIFYLYYSYILIY
jgi:hypothetical protein